MTIRVGDLIALGAIIALILFFLYRRTQLYAYEYERIVKQNEIYKKLNEKNAGKYTLVDNPSKAAADNANRSTKNAFVALGSPAFTALLGYFAVSRGYTIGWVLVGISTLYFTVIASWWMFFFMLSTLFGRRW